MIGRPRRRHVIDRSGRLHRATKPVAPIQITQSPRLTQTEQPNETQLIRAIQVRRVLKVIAIGLGFLVGIFLLWAIVSSFVAYRKVTDHNSTKKAPALNFLGELKPNQLQGEGDGRINVLLIGIGGAKHPGGNLADTLMVASFDPKNKEVALLSIPRDLWVPIEGHGYAKINASHAYGEQFNKQNGGGPVLAKKTVSKILDLPIHYYVRVDFSGFEELVDAIGGVTVDQEKPIVDLSYPADNMIDYAPFRLNAGVQTLDGRTALKFARSRHAAGSEGSDFARAKRQQKLIEAIKQKALTAGVLANPKKINELVGILGDHVKTDISLTEMQRFVELWKNVDSSKIVSKVLDNGPEGPFISQSGDERGYILLPRTGDYSEVQEIAHSIFTDPYLRQEKATIELINATGNLSTGLQVTKLLTSYGYTVSNQTQKGQKTELRTSLLDHVGTKPFTVKFLEDRFKTNATLRKDATSSYDLTLTLGADYKPSSLKTGQLKITTSPSIRLKESPNEATTQ